ncbi:reverse transcriptase domain-containing protein [Streptomyces sp. NPDC050704]|uniref:reverse transcriptase domain-containing protein n=1 Tax=Streptomyces sp. NPDC050704 TaxID=3157219 RepID=UPI0034444835
MLEPVFEAEFLPCSYGFRPNRRAHDAIAETRYLASHGYEWVVEGDITACFDEISHPALMERVRNRIGDKRVLSLVKAFLKSGILSRDGAFTDTRTGTPQGGILSPLLANIALSVLDEHIARGLEDQTAPPRTDAGDGAGDCPTTGWSGMRTISSCLSSSAVSTPKNYATRSQRR